MAETPDEITVGQSAAVAKLYSLSVLDEVRAAAGKFLAELDDIKRRYTRELSPGPEQFRSLLAMAEQVERDTGSSASRVIAPNSPEGA